MPPELGRQTGGEYAEEGGQQGNFLTKKVGPLPMWAILAAGVIIIYVLYTKYFANTNSSTNPAVQTNPSSDTSSGTFPWDNLTSALSQIQGNEQGIASSLQTANPTQTGSSSAPVNPNPVNNTSNAYGNSAPTATPIGGSNDLGTGTGLGPGGGQIQTPTSSIPSTKVVRGNSVAPSGPTGQAAPTPSNSTYNEVSTKSGWWRVFNPIAALTMPKNVAAVPSTAGHGNLEY